MKPGTTEKREEGRDKKAVQETLGRVAEQPARPDKEAPAKEENSFQKKTGEIKRDFGR
jgi:hypothetical protein